MARWKVLGRRELYRSGWVDLDLAEVELPDGTRLEHHVVTVRPDAVAVVVRDRGRVLALRRHRFIGDFEGWEVPAGRLEPGETPEAGAVRECLEETGWRALRPRLVVSGRPAPGLFDLVHHVVLCEGAEQQGAPRDAHESDRVEWVPEDDLFQLLRRGEVADGYSQYALLAVRAGL